MRALPRSRGLKLATPAAARKGYPSRIVCLTEETTEILYRLGAGDLVVGVSGYTVRPPEARQKPRVSSFLSADYDKVQALSPDIVFAFSDLQADISRELVKRGVQVFTFNQRSLAQILTTVRVVGSIVGYHQEAEELAAELESNVARVRWQASLLPRRPRVFFEEWDEPLISGICWVSELVEIAGGEDCFAELRHEQGAKGRIVEPAEVVFRNPEVIVGSWCGKKFRPEDVVTRPGFDEVRAVLDGRLHEVKSSVILQPGPAALTSGLSELHRVIAAAAKGEPPPAPRVSR